MRKNPIGKGRLRKDPRVKRHIEKLAKAKVASEGGCPKEAAKEMLDYLYDTVSKADPTKTGDQFSSWLIWLVVTGQIQNEDADKINDYLTDYLTEARKRRSTEDALTRAILEDFAKEKSVNFAYTTYRFVR